MNEYFCVDVGAYVAGKNFSVVRSASLANPKSNAVMFVLEDHVSAVDTALESVNECNVLDGAVVKGNPAR